MRSAAAKGFTLVQLVVVIAVLAILTGVLVPRVSDHMAVARDARRLADVRTIRTAIEQYRMDKGGFPAAERNPAFGGWDVSHDGGFIRELRNEGYIDGEHVDPVNDVTYHYRYFLYEMGSFGCAGEEDFYVLGVRNFESPNFARKHQGFFECANRDWGKEFAYVTGGGA
ncbi:MAG: hypothetical protein O7B99_10920, partial [Planctomycetota bacterium]|nr:hypothetical protein [Planctomycetota bacterium]